jgi:hypothetical protein
MVGRRASELCGDHDAALAAAHPDEPDTPCRSLVVRGRFVVDLDDHAHSGATSRGGTALR